VTIRSTTSHKSIWTDFLGHAFAQRFIDASGIRTRMLEAGKQGAPVLIFIHGTGGHAEAYSRNIGAHASDFHVFSIDLVGHGFSDKPQNQRYEIADYVEHLKNFLDAIGAEAAHISGESLGGWVAAAFALRYPKRVKRLVLNTAGGYTAFPEVMEKIKKVTLAAVQNPSWDTVKARLEFLMKDPKSVTDDLVAVRLAVYRQPGFANTMEGILCLQEMDIRRRNMFDGAALGRIEAPTLVVWTTHDPTAPASVGREIAGHIPGARFALMENCGHWPQFEDAETFNRLHLDFLLEKGR
jgi:2-hydroxy-6-oxonona-2,4-dienedioate hydrolase